METKKAQLENEKSIVQKQHQSLKAKVDDLEQKYAYLIREHEQKCLNLADLQRELEQLRQESQNTRLVEYERRRAQETADQYLQHSIELEQRLNHITKENERLSIAHSE